MPLSPKMVGGAAVPGGGPWAAGVERVTYPLGPGRAGVGADEPDWKTSRMVAHLLGWGDR